MKDWLIKKVLFGYLKGFLDKLPLNNYKTIIGVVVFILVIVMQAIPETAPFIAPVLEILKPYAESIQDVAISTAVVGLIHKLLKRFEK